MSGQGAPGPALWADACLSAALVAIDPAGLGGIAVRARHGPVRSAWLAMLRALLPAEMPFRRMPARIDDERLLGGLDLVATLDAGRPVSSRGLLAESDGGLVLLAMAERAGEGLVARLSAALDTGVVKTERDGLSLRHSARIGIVALDEGADEDERPSGALLDRLAFRADLTALGQRDLAPSAYTAADVAEARARLTGIETDDAALSALTTSAAALGIGSLRGPLLAMRALSAIRALFGEALDPAEAATIAARLVLAPRATRLPAPDQEAEAPEPPTPDDPEDQQSDDDRAEDGVAPLSDRVLEAAQAAIPPGLLAELAANGARGPSGELGRAGAVRTAPDRGRPLGSRPGHPGGGHRIDLVATLRTAAPWQRLRKTTERAVDKARIHIRASDLRVRRFKRHSASATVFAVDASGSTAMARLAEAKGAIEILLAEAYVRRDLVALVAFRGSAAEILLPPTAAPALARKRLAALPGGGGTPLALGIDAAAALASRLEQRGTLPRIVLLTDGRANIDRTGAPGRPAAAADASASAKACRAAGHSTLLIDTGTRPRPEAAALATDLGARYLAMPRADAHSLSRAARIA